MSLATVQRMRHERDGLPCLPYVEHRTRDLAVLFTEDEWGWSSDSGEAYVFPRYELPAISSPNDFERSAEAHVAWLKARGVSAWPCIYGNLAAQQRALREASRLASVEASVSALVPAGGVDPVMPEPEFETGGRPPIRERIRRARKSRQKRGVSSVEVYAETSRRLGEGGE